MSLVCELVNVSKKYGEHVVLDGMDAAVAQGEMVAIVGRSGSGKSTVLNLLGLIERPDGGVVRLFGEDAPRAGSANANRLRRQRLSYLFQNGALIESETVFGNLEIPLIHSGGTRRERQRWKLDALQKVGLPDAGKVKIHELSGGEQQRVAVARLLLRPHDLILADEPTGSIDTESADDVVRLLRDLNRAGTTVVIVTHDPRVAGSCDRIIPLRSSGTSGARRCSARRTPG